MTSLLRRSRPRAATARPSATNPDAPFSRARAQQNPMGMAAAMEDLREQGLAMATDAESEERWLDEVDAAQSAWAGAAEEEGGAPPPPPGPGPVNPSMAPPSGSSSNSGGMSIGFPDVCKMPGPPAPFVPIPYPNISASSGLSKSTTGTKTTGTKDQTATKAGSSSGDEAGTTGGVKSAIHRGAYFGSKVSKPQRYTSPFSHHGTDANTPSTGTLIKPSQNKLKLGS